MTFDHTGNQPFGGFLISSRSLGEYRAMFALTDTDLRRRLLDCPGGAAGFTAAVRGLGGDVTACDLAYAADGTAEVAATAPSTRSPLRRQRLRPRAQLAPAVQLRRRPGLRVPSRRGR